MEKSDIEKKRKEGWIECMFMIEAVATKEDAVKKALEIHVDKMSRHVEVYEKKFLDVLKIENPTPKVKEGYSCIVETKIFAKDFTTLYSTIMLYGPSSIEVLGPKNRVMTLEDAQKLANITADLVHRFAAAGPGGIVITPER